MLTATITKFSVDKRPGHNDFECTMRYNSDMSIGTIKTKFQTKIASDWDRYESEQTIFDATAFDNMVGQLQVAANTYIN